MSFRRISPALRVYHWTLAGGCAVAWLVESSSREAHAWLGYLAAAAVVWRLGYALFGPAPARVGVLMFGPRRVLQWLRELLRGRAPLAHGYNPLAAWNVLAMLVTVLALGASGHLLRTDAFWGDETLQSLHALASDLLWGLVALHLIGLAVGSWRARYPLPLAMIDGKEPPH
ncbi:MAG: cytochrome b/b6 domain-containing protein [Thiomonas sp.]